MSAATRKQADHGRQLLRSSGLLTAMCSLLRQMTTPSGGGGSPAPAAVGCTPSVGGTQSPTDVSAILQGMQAALLSRQNRSLLMLSHPHALADTVDQLCVAVGSAICECQDSRGGEEADGIALVLLESPHLATIEHGIAVCSLLLLHVPGPEEEEEEGGEEEDHLSPSLHGVYGGGDGNGGAETEAEADKTESGSASSDASLVVCGGAGGGEKMAEKDDDEDQQQRGAGVAGYSQVAAAGAPTCLRTASTTATTTEALGLVQDDFVRYFVGKRTLVLLCRLLEILKPSVSIVAHQSRMLRLLEGVLSLFEAATSFPFRSGGAVGDGAAVGANATATATATTTTSASSSDASPSPSTAIPSSSSWHVSEVSELSSGRLGQRCTDVMGDCMREEGSVLLIGPLSFVAALIVSECGDGTATAVGGTGAGADPVGGGGGGGGDGASKTSKPSHKKKSKSKGKGGRKQQQEQEQDEGEEEEEEEDRRTTLAEASTGWSPSVTMMNVVVPHMVLKLSYLAVAALLHLSRLGLRHVQEVLGGDAVARPAFERVYSTVFAVMSGEASVSLEHPRSSNAGTGGPAAAHTPAATAGGGWAGDAVGAGAAVTAAAGTAVGGTLSSSAAAAAPCSTVDKALLRGGGKEGKGKGSSASSSGNKTSAMAASTSKSVVPPTGAALSAALGPGYEVGWREGELLSLLGYFALGNRRNQDMLTWGPTPTLLVRLCNLPFRFFSDDRHREQLLPTLLSICLHNASNTAVADRELSVELLSDFLRRGREDWRRAREAAVSPTAAATAAQGGSVAAAVGQEGGSNGRNGSRVGAMPVPVSRWERLSQRFPTALWDEAIAFFEHDEQEEQHV